MFDIGLSTVKRWAKLKKETGSLKPIKPSFIRKRKVSYEILLMFVQKNPSKTLLEIGKEFKLSDVGVLKILRKLNITYKKKVFIRRTSGKSEIRLQKQTIKNK